MVQLLRDAPRVGVYEWGPHSTWFEIRPPVGEVANDTVLIFIHGGAGLGYEYMEPALDLFPDWTRVVYQQTGVGRSPRPDEVVDSTWTVELFTEELRGLLNHLGIDGPYVLVGHSWGAMIALEHAVGNPPGLTGLVLYSGLSSVPAYLSEIKRLRGGLQSDIVRAFEAHEANGDLDHPDYKSAEDAFSREFVCRIPHPAVLTVSYQHLLADPTVARLVNGPSRFVLNGVIREWDFTSRLPEILIPSLVIRGEHDEITPWVADLLAVGLESAQVAEIAGASHIAHLENPPGFKSAVDGFLESLAT